MELDARAVPAWRGNTEEETCVRVIFFEDTRGSSALKERFAEESDEEAFHALRREHDDRIRRGEHEALLHALNGVANQWDSLFP